eukprot:TRINITY_DN55528_c0_g1_i1.p1 TRINITY_DN55528_c0_g1~~TRINITY_DN55528_c0_g1_i1.p1  ORF type:complete len:564 (+),score=215.63 TRINITY_DN55528_c0_g1_i1:69-1694(+)
MPPPPRGAAPGGRGGVPGGRGGLSGLQPTPPGTPSAFPGQPATPASAQQPAALQLAADHSFQLKQRRLVDHRLRTPHRRFLPDTLQRVTAHWTAVPARSAPLLTTHVDIDARAEGDEVLPPWAEKIPETAAPAETLNARVLLVPGLRQGASRDSTLRRVEVIAGTAGPLAKAEAHGGRCTRGSDLEVIRQLVPMVMAQCGLDLRSCRTWYKFLELSYEGGATTVFFVPGLHTLGAAKLRKQVEHVRVEEEEEVETEEEDEEATKKQREEGGDSSAKPVMRKVTKRRTVTKEQKKTAFRPLKLTLAMLLELPVHAQSPHSTVELCAAADALDEFLKREMALRILDRLKELQAKRNEDAKRAAQRKQGEQERKRKRAEEAADRKRARLDKEDHLRLKWVEEDEGRTDEDKRAAMAERMRILRELAATHAEQEAAAQAAEQAPTGEGRDENAEEVVQSLFDAFAHFDRCPGFSRVNGSLPRLKLENLLLCVDDEMTLRRCRELLGWCPQHVAYHTLASRPVDPSKERQEQQERQGSPAQEGEGG